MKSRLLLLLTILLLAGNVFAQRYAVDTSFTPFFNLFPMGKSSKINTIWESPINGKLWILGNFNFVNGVRHGGITSINKDGSRNLDFIGGVGGSEFVPYTDTSYIITGSSAYGQFDTSGVRSTRAWEDNFNNTARCVSSTQPYIFKDGSLLVSNSNANFGACDIINLPDTFPHRYIIKVTPDGLWDSTFTHESNDVVRGFLPYDSNRLWVYGQSWRFQYYDSVYVHGLCRIYTDGRLDTTFKNPFQDSTFYFGFNQIMLIQPTLPDGDVLVSGQLYLKGDTTMHTLMRLNADGSLDTNFRNFESPKDTAFAIRAAVYSAVPTADGGFLVGGGFNNYQGHSVNCIAKIDSTGKIEPNAIPFHGPDSSAANGTFTYPLHYIFKIIPSKFGGYYVVGDFKLWDSLPTNPIKRLVLDNTVGLNEKLRITNNSIDLFPNPTSGILNMHLSANTSIKQLQLFDLVGKAQKVKWQKNQLNLSPLPNGIYFLQVQLNNGETLSRKIIKN